MLPNSVPAAFSNLNPWSLSNTILAPTIFISPPKKFSPVPVTVICSEKRLLEADIEPDTVNS